MHGGSEYVPEATIAFLLSSAFTIHISLLANIFIIKNDSTVFCPTNLWMFLFLVLIFISVSSINFRNCLKKVLLWKQFKFSTHEFLAFLFFLNYAILLNILYWGDFRFLFYWSYSAYSFIDFYWPIDDLTVLLTYWPFIDLTLTLQCDLTQYYTDWMGVSLEFKVFQ